MTKLWHLTCAAGWVGIWVWILLKWVGFSQTGQLREKLPCKQALLGALAAKQEKGGRIATTSLEFEYLHQKSRCEMLIGGDDISNDVNTLAMCCSKFFLTYFAHNSASHWLAEIWQLSRWGATGELKEEFKSQRHSCKLSFLPLPPTPRRQSTPQSLLAG